MDYLQYRKVEFNLNLVEAEVLNLIINGLPSILKEEINMKTLGVFTF